MSLFKGQLPIEVTCNTSLKYIVFGFLFILLYCSSLLFLKLIRELREEVEKLKMQLLKHGIKSDKEVLQEALDQNEKLMQEASLTWEQKEKQTERIHQVLNKSS